MRTLTMPQVRRAALRASGLLRPRPDRVDVRHFRRVLDDLDVVQLDSVNVLTRAHELPFWSRLGAVDTEALRRWLWLSRDAHECWAHVASVMPMDAEPLLRFRRERFRHPWESVQRLVEQDPAAVTRIEHTIRSDGPLTVSDLGDVGPRSGQFWDWNVGKHVLHWLFLSGRTAVHERTRSFLAAYAPRDEVVPGHILDAPTPPAAEAHDALVARALRAQAVGTVDDLADHHRLKLRDARAALDRLTARGRAVPVRVQGWDQDAWADPDLVVPRGAEARALVSPFDPIAWYRPRLERLHDFHYRIEIYVPAPKRQYGYYVLPFLLGDRFVARVDLKANRQTGRLEVRGAFAEPGVDHARVARELATELSAMGAWLGTPEVAVADHGDLAPPLRAVTD
jgi:uncharacterized protein